MKWKVDRAWLWVYFLFFLYLWDAAFFVGIRNPASLPHPFAVFRRLGDIEFLRGFTSMLREFIFSFVSGGLVGVAIGANFLRSSWLTEALIRVLRIVLWVPLIIIFAGIAPLISGIMTAMLSSAYHYLAGRSLLALKTRDALTYATREALLLTLLISLIAQLWVDHWRWFDFTIPSQPAKGLLVFAALAVLVGFNNWCFRSSFMVTAHRHALLQSKDITHERRESTYQVIFVTAVCLTTWELLSVSGLDFVRVSPTDALAAVYHLSLGGEIWRDMGLSLLEVVCGIALGCLLALGILLVTSAKTNFRNPVFSLLRVTYISAIVLWLIAFTWSFGVKLPGFLYFWHKVIAVGCLAFFPLFESLWVNGKRPFLHRILIATDAALPFAFVAMSFGEAWAATQGLGFAMTVATAIHQRDKAIAVFLITFALLVGLSCSLRWIAKRFYSSAAASEMLYG